MSSPFGQLKLFFVQQNESPIRLDRTTFEFTPSSTIIEAKRGAYHEFKWTSAVQALSMLLVQTTSNHIATLANTQQKSESPILRGHRPSPAATLNDALTKKHRWLFDMFGSSSPQLPALGEFLARRNADFNTDPKDQVEVWLDTTQFPAERIAIHLNDQFVIEPDQLDRIAANILSQWEQKPSKSTAGRTEPLQKILKAFDPNAIKEYFDQTPTISLKMWYSRSLVVPDYHS